MVLSDGQERPTLLELMESSADLLIGEEAANGDGWVVLSKLFDNRGPIPHHLHPNDEQAALVGKLGKPEAYYFPPQYNPHFQTFPYTFFGLRPGTTQGMLADALTKWDQGDNGILDLSLAYRLEVGSGWLVPPGVLHAPGTLVTYEPQRASDVFAIFQSQLEGRALSRELLVKDVPPAHHDDIDYIVSLVDWEQHRSRPNRQQAAEAVAVNPQRPGRAHREMDHVWMPRVQRQGDDGEAGRQGDAERPCRVRCARRPGSRPAGQGAGIGALDVALRRPE